MTHHSGGAGGGGGGGGGDGGDAGGVLICSAVFSGIIVSFAASSSSGRSNTREQLTNRSLPESFHPPARVVAQILVLLNFFRLLSLLCLSSTASALAFLFAFTTNRKLRQLTRLRSGEGAAI